MDAYGQQEQMEGGAQGGGAEVADTDVRQLVVYTDSDDEYREEFRPEQPDLKSFARDKIYVDKGQELAESLNLADDYEKYQQSKETEIKYLGKFISESSQLADTYASEQLVKKLTKLMQEAEEELKPTHHYKLT